MESFDLLGPAERHVAKEIRTSLEAAQKTARELADALEAVNTDGLEDALLDSERKEAVISLAGAMPKMPGSLAIYQLYPILLDATLKPRDAVDA